MTDTIRTNIEDFGFGRIPFFDERSREYPIRTAVATKKPRSYTWRCIPRFDQKTDGSCVGFGIVHELAARPTEVKTVDEKYAKEQIYWPAQRTDQWSGGSYPGASPFHEGTSVIAGVKIAHSLNWFGSYRWSFSFDDFVLGIGHNGPAVTGTNWHEGMLRPDVKGEIFPTGQVVGGHCYLVNGIDIKTRLFCIHNSWGASWGINGEAFISFENMRKLLKEQGEAVFFMRRKMKSI